MTFFWVFTKQTNADKDQVKAAIKAQQDQQIDNVSSLIVLQYYLHEYLIFHFKGISFTSRHF